MNSTVSGGFPAQSTSNAKLWWCLCSQLVYVYTFRQTVMGPVNRFVFILMCCYLLVNYISTQKYVVQVTEFLMISHVMSDFFFTQIVLSGWNSILLCCLLFLSCHQSLVSIKRCCLPSIGILIIKIRLSYHDNWNLYRWKNFLYYCNKMQFIGRWQEFLLIKFITWHRILCLCWYCAACQLIHR